MADRPDQIPDVFCWTRYGIEAGELVEEILMRKELERLTTGGTFYWGIGSSIAPGLRELLRICAAPEVLFSPIKGRPRPVDTAPHAIAIWRAGESIDGIRSPVPPGVRVTSGIGDRPRPRYALTCWRESPLVLDELGHVRAGDLTNLLSGRGVGASQVTAVVRWARSGDSARYTYPVRLRAHLVPPYLVRLCDPVVVQDVSAASSTGRTAVATDAGRLRLFDQHQPWTPHVVRSWPGSSEDPYGQWGQARLYDIGSDGPSPLSDPIEPHDPETRAAQIVPGERSSLGARQVPFLADDDQAPRF